ncbi:MAG: hypothetical protein ACP5HM_08655 [Anaerolineae bacterium]
MTEIINQHQDEKAFGDEAVTWSSVLWRSVLFFALLLFLLYVGLHWPG